MFNTLSLEHTIFRNIYRCEKFELSLELANTSSRLTTVEKIKFSLKNFFCKCDQIRVFIVNFEYISPRFSTVSVVDFEQVNESWVDHDSNVIRGLFRTMSNISNEVYLRKY